MIRWLRRQIVRACYRIVFSSRVLNHPCFDVQTHMWFHDWKTDGGRHCDICEHSQPVFVCQRCGEIDYGTAPSGPGMDHCRNHCTYRYRGDFT